MRICRFGQEVPRANTIKDDFSWAEGEGETTELQWIIANHSTHCDFRAPGGFDVTKTKSQYNDLSAELWIRQWALFASSELMTRICRDNRPMDFTAMRSVGPISSCRLMWIAQSCNGSNSLGSGTTLTIALHHRGVRSYVIRPPRTSQQPNPIPLCTFERGLTWARTVFWLLPITGLRMCSGSAIQPGALGVRSLGHLQVRRTRALHSSMGVWGRSGITSTLSIRWTSQSQIV